MVKFRQSQLDDPSQCKLDQFFAKVKRKRVECCHCKQVKKFCLNLYQKRLLLYLLLRNTIHAIV